VQPHQRFGVIFDMDGVLVDSAASHLESWRRLAEENDGTVTEQQFRATFGQQNRDIVPLLFGPVSASRLKQLADRKEEMYRDLVGVNPPIVQGAVALVQELHDAGVTLAVGSSGPRENVDLILQAMGVATIVPVVVSGDDVTRGKPDPQVFQLAIRRLGLPPDQCVVVEDAPVGVQAAKAAGARSVALLLHHPREAFEGVDLIVPRLADLTIAGLRSLVSVC
jgi:beta-phosphoglucomutase